MPPREFRWRDPRLLIPIAVVLTFLPALGAGFVNWDDQKNFLNNPDYRGLSPDRLRWMFTTFLLGHYQPLSWVSLGLDYELWGMNPFGYHLTSLLLHAANSLLLYLAIASLLKREGPCWPAAAGALVHALHPLRVESVVWITERRDVLCGFFALLSVLAYLRHVRTRRSRWLALSLLAFTASLLSKALSIALPAVLLLMDMVPLGRWTAGSRRRVLLEKLPFALLSLADAAVMFSAMGHIDAVRPLASYDVLERAAQACYGLCFYVVKTLWPSGLLPIYRIDAPLHPGEAKYVLSMIAVAAATALLIALRKRRPALLATWLAYVALVFPVLGVAVTGMQVAADRYTYLALMPLAVLAGFLLDRIPRCTTTAAAILLAFSATTAVQCGVWQDSYALWTHMLRYDPDSDLAWNSRGAARRDHGDLEGAIEDFSRSLELAPRSFDARLNRGLALAALGRLEAALKDFDAAIVLDPRRADGFASRGVAKVQKGDLEGAFADLTEAIRIGGRDAESYAARGSIRGSRGDLAGAAADFEAALKAAPPDWPARRDVEAKLGTARRQRSR